MMNELDMSSDGINLYVNIKVKANKLVIRIAVTVLILLISFILIGAIKESKDISTEAGIFAIIGIFFFLYFPVKYLLWNLYGEEELIINTKSISYSYDYGWFKTKMETIEFVTLGVSLDEMRLDGKEYLGQLYFTAYDKNTQVPEVIHSTTVFLDMHQILELQLGISSLFEQSLYQERGFIPFSLN